MYKSKRHFEILEYIYAKKEATVNELSEEFGVSKVTIRKDLIELATKGKVVKTHGGAVPAENLLVNEVPYYRRNTSALEEKKQIGAVAASFIKQNDIVIIDNGSTTNEMVPYLYDKNIVVITNDIRISYRLAAYNSINLIVTGGHIKRSGYAMFGSITESFYKNIIANICFLSIDSIDIEYGISYNYMESKTVKEYMMRSSEKVIAVFDSSKIGKKSFSKLCDVQDIDMLITDYMDNDLKNAFEEKGVTVIIAD